MKLLRMLLAVGLGLVAWRAVHGRGRQLLRSALRMSHPAPHAFEEPARAAQDTRGHHTSAASAANEDFRDDRDVIVGENLSAVGMRPGAR